MGYRRKVRRPKPGVTEMTDDELFTADMARLYAMADEVITALPVLPSWECRDWLAADAVITALPSWEYQDWLDQWQLVAVRFDQL